MPLLSRKEKKWYLLLSGKEEGPFSANEVMLDYRVDLDTLAWKEGFEEWKPIRQIPELKKLFKKESEDENEKKITLADFEPQDEVALDLNRNPNFFFFWLLITLVLFSMLYLIYALQ